MPLSVGKLGPYLTQCSWAKAYLGTKWHLDPSNRLATIHQHTNATDRTDKTTVPYHGEPLLVMVAQKLQLVSQIQEYL